MSDAGAMTHQIILSTDARSLKRGDRYAWLRPSGAKIVAVLAANFPDAAPPRTIQSALWPDGRFPADAKGTVKVQMFNLRADCEPLGLTIEYERDYGYRLNRAVAVVPSFRRGAA